MACRAAPSTRDAASANLSNSERQAPGTHEDAAHPSDREVLAGLVAASLSETPRTAFASFGSRRRRPRTVRGARRHNSGRRVDHRIGGLGQRPHPWAGVSARFLKTWSPTTVEGTQEGTLPSGMIRGIGPTYAKKLLRAFGEKVFDVIETQADRLREVGGIAGARGSDRRRLGRAEGGAGIIVFLHSHGVGTARAVRIFKTMVPTPSIMTRTPIVWHAISAASASRPPTPWHEARQEDRHGAGPRWYPMRYRGDGRGHCGVPTGRTRPAGGEAA